jgi:hypothetical protein
VNEALKLGSLPCVHCDQLQGLGKREFDRCTSLPVLPTQALSPDIDLDVLVESGALIMIEDAQVLIAMPQPVWTVPGL